MILGVFIKQHKRSAHHTVLLVSHSSNLDLVCECFIYRWWATQTASSQKNSKHKLGRTAYIYSRAIPPPLFFHKVPSSSYHVFQISFSLMVFLSFLFSKHCQQHILTINLSFLLPMLTTDYTHKPCSIIGRSP